MWTIYRSVFSEADRGLLVLLDPDRSDEEHLNRLLPRLNDSPRVRAVLVGTSILMFPGLDTFVERVKNKCRKPVILFPGSVVQLTPKADALLYLVMVSGRNPELLIGEHVKAAPLIRHYGMEAIATAYILVESGAYTAVEYVSFTRPIPRNKPEIVVAHALAAYYMGMKAVYLEGGSGAREPVPAQVIRAVREAVPLPLIVGGGLRTREQVETAFQAGANLAVVGTALEEDPDLLELL